MNSTDKGSKVRKDTLSTDVDRPGKAPGYFWVVTSLSVIGSFLFGYDASVVSGAMVYVRKDFHSVTDLDQEIIIATAIAAAFLFSLAVGPLNDKMGRKKTIIASSGLFTIGAIILAAAPNMAVLMVGRGFIGAAIGFSSGTVPAYLAELSPFHLRGAIVALYLSTLTFGDFVASVLNGFFAYLPNNVGWRLMFGVAAIPALIQMIGFCFMPESPRWLAISGHCTEALDVLRKVRSSEEESQNEIDEIISTYSGYKEEKNEKGGKFVLWSILKNTNTRRCLFVGCLLQIFQQLSGINTLLYYTASILIMAGISNPHSSIWISAAVVFLHFVFTIPGVYLIDRVGRRIMLLGSMGVCIICLLLLGIGFTLIHDSSLNVSLRYDTDAARRYFNISWSGNCTDYTKYKTCDDCSYLQHCGFCYLKHNKSLTGACVPKSESSSMSSSFAEFGYCAPANASLGIDSTMINSDAIFAEGWCPTNYFWLPIIGMLMYLCAISVGFCQVPWTVNSEIYPQWARSTGNACATASNWFFNLIISLTFLTLSDAIKREGAFFLYAGLTSVGWILFYLFVPETRNKSLEELENVFTDSLLQVGRKKIAKKRAK